MKLASSYNYLSPQVSASASSGARLLLSHHYVNQHQHSHDFPYFHKYVHVGNKFKPWGLIQSKSQMLIETSHFTCYWCQVKPPSLIIEFAARLMHPLHLLGTVTAFGGRKQAEMLWKPSHLTSASSLPAECDLAHNCISTLWLILLKIFCSGLRCWL